MTLSYQEAANAAVVLDYSGTPAVVSGLNTLKLPGAQRTIIEVKQFRETSRQFAGSSSRTNLEFGGNAVFNDTGQIALRTLYENNSKFGSVGHANGECRVYLNKSSSADHYLDSDFLAPDTANDSVSCFQVASYEYPSTDVDGMFPFSSGLLCNGRTAIFTEHYTADTIAFVDGDPAADTITDSANGFVTAGFAAGQVLIVEGTVNNDGIYIIDSVAAGTITLTAAGALAAEGSGTDFTLHGGS
jgi:hypothetical protein